MEIENAGEVSLVNLPLGTVANWGGMYVLLVNTPDGSRRLTVELRTGRTIYTKYATGVPIPTAKLVVP